MEELAQEGNRDDGQPATLLGYIRILFYRVYGADSSCFVHPCPCMCRVSSESGTVTRVMETYCCTVSRIASRWRLQVVRPTRSSLFFVVV